MWWRLAIGLGIGIQPSASSFSKLPSAIDRRYQQAIYGLGHRTCDNPLRQAQKCRARLGVRRQRIVIQCKHWRTKSINVADVASLRSQMELWQPPRVDVLVIATTGRFTVDAVDLIEKHNQADRALAISMWPDSHLERLLAARPHLIAQFRLRRS